MSVDTGQHYPIDIDSLPASWQAAYVGDAIYDIQPGFPCGKHNKDGLGVPHLRPFNVDRLGRLDISEMKFVAADADHARIGLGDVLFNNTNSPELIGKTTVVSIPGEWAFSNHMTRLRPPDCLDAYFVAYQLHYLWMTGYFRHRCTHHVNQASISSSTLADSVPLVVAPTNEQRRIVAEIEKQLTRLDAAVTALKRVQANLKRYRAAVLKAACEGRLVPTEAELARKEGRPYETGEQLLARILQERRAKWEADQLAHMVAAGKPPNDDSWKKKYKEAEPPDTASLPDLPEGWTVASLEQITSAVRPICYGILMPKDNVANGVLYVRVKDMKGDRIDLPGLHRTAPEIAAEYERASLRTGDLLLAIRGTYGRVADVPPELDGGNITQDTVRLDLNELVDAAYVATCLRSPLAQNYFKRVARGVAVKGVNVADVRTCPIMLPPRMEQLRISQAVDTQLSVNAEVQVEIEHGLRRADRLRQSILKRAFEGKLVPQDPTDEPASVLLERVRAERNKTVNADSSRRPRRKRAAAAMEAT